MQVLVILNPEETSLAFCTLLQEFPATLQLIGGEELIIMTPCEDVTTALAGDTIRLEKNSLILFIDLPYDNISSLEEIMQLMGIKYTKMAEWTGDELGDVEIYHFPFKMPDERLERWYHFWFAENLSSYEQYEQIRSRLILELKSIRHGIYASFWDDTDFEQVIEDRPVDLVDCLDSNKPIKNYTFTKGQQLFDIDLIDEDVEAVKNILEKVGLQIKHVTTNTDDEECVLCPVSNEILSDEDMHFV